MNNERTYNEEMLELYRVLPEEIKDALFAPETTDIYEGIKTRHELSAGERSIISNQAGLLMMGLVHPRELLPNLIAELKLPREKVAPIVQDLNRELFAPLKDILKIIHGLDEGAQTTEPKTAPTSKPSAPILSPLSIPAPLEPKVTQEIKQVPPPIQVKVVVQPVIKKEVVAEAPPTPIPTGNRRDTFQGQGVTSVAPVQEKPKLHVPHKPKNTSGAIMPNILEQKLGGAFRIQKDSTAYAVPHGAPETISPPTSTPTDPYRELP